MDSYLDGSYLGASSVQIQEPQPAAVLAPQPQPTMLAGWDEPIRLPGGIVMTKKTLLIVAAVAAVLIYLAAKKRKG